MAIVSRKNQYPGVNAHLHSLLQNEFGSWPVFHSAHIIDLARAIDRKLPPGYVVAPEQSLQIREFDPDTGQRLVPPGSKGLKPDIEIYETAAAHPRPSPSPSAVTAPTLTLSPAISLEPEDYYTAAVQAAHRRGENLEQGPFTILATEDTETSEIGDS